MKTTITEFLSTILTYLLKWQFPVCKFLNDGLEESEIRALFNSSGITPTNELIELYQWRNGTNIVQGTMLDDIQIIPGFHFLSLQDSVNNYSAMKNDKRWNPSWFPIFANGGGDFYAVDLSQSTGDTAPIIGFILGEAEQEIEYQSLTTMLLTFCECYENKVVFRTEGGYLEMDDDEQAEIALKHNPEVKFWQS
ncbi:SMI1/KNR4 family protein [Vibrio caribbeanicus]|uniref:HEAT repeat-containing PBS lyase n=1 Tax=Vibrio caribbeanicus ATCC BAA-2122 TaxID=796620 RepID=E3BGP9_9VIBR|nr:SMI1/KNR4 family protein [Vibrio caribbeanicus]EFP97773.1 HEAT repeat-containing PBS lyase [Vibrio caribbeanicus ATCC BAA-2122]